MNLDFSDDQKSLRADLARLLAARQPLRGTRAALEGTAAYDAPLWRELASLGWLGIALPEAYGGQALGAEMLCCAAEELGRAMVALPHAASIFLAAEAILLHGTPEQKQQFLPALGTGAIIGAFALAESPGPLTKITTSFQNNRLTGSKIAVTDGALANLFIVAGISNGEPQLFIVEAGAPGLTRHTRTGVDPSHAPAELHFHQTPAEPLGPPGWPSIQRVLDRAAVLIAFEQLGTADTALNMATAYAKERKAFGRPIGAFQSIKHKLADVWIANELARANAYYAAWALGADAPELPLAAATARICASEALERAARENIQVHGGIAVTWAHDAHLFYRRGQHLSLVLGSQRDWQHRLTTQLAA
jgi:alkylation response protein AidB-like acyl-CoA dehydrogenase